MDEVIQEPRSVMPLRGGLASVLSVLAGVARLVPHPDNCTPVGAMGLFGGARLRTWQAFAIPLLIMGVTDLILLAWFDYQPFNVFVYASFLINVLLGRFLRNSESVVRIGGLTLLCSLQFYLLTNFGAWYRDALHTYSPDLSGLRASYVAGLPFFARTLLGDVVFSGTLFGLHAWLARTSLGRVPAKSTAIVS